MRGGDFGADDDTYMDGFDEVEDWMVGDPGSSAGGSPTAARSRRRRKRRARFLRGPSPSS